MIKRKRALVAGFMMLFALVAGAGEAGQAKDPTPNAARWKITQQVINETPYRMRVLSTTLTELTEWERLPAKEIEPNGGRDVHIFHNDAPGHGLVGHVVYGAYDAKTNAFAGMVIARSGIDCNARTDVGCLAFHRWEGVACDSNGTVKGRWYDNAGDPTNFWTEIHFVTSGGACNGFAAPAVQAEGPGPSPGAWWRVTGNFVNASPFRLKLRNVWNSEATHFGDLPDTVFPPLEIQPRQSREKAWRYANEEKLHGPSAIIMYDAFDPDAGNRYVGSITFGAGVDCGPKWATGLGCLSFTQWARDSTDAIPGYELRVDARPGGNPPHDFVVDNFIAGGRKGAALARTVSIMATRKNDDDIDYNAEGSTPPHEKDDPTNTGYDEAAHKGPGRYGVPEGEGGVFGTTGGGTYSGGLHEVDREDEPER